MFEQVINEDKLLSLIRNNSRKIVVDHIFIEQALQCDNLDIINIIIKNCNINNNILNHLKNSQYHDNPNFIRGLKFIENSKKNKF